MQTLFDQIENEKMINRINQLIPDSKPLWGKMTPAQMLTHLQKPLEVAFGDLNLKHSFIGFLFGKMAKKKMLGEGPFSKNLPTDASFKITNDRNFEQEKAKTISLVKTMVEKGPAGITTNAHPFFGKMNVTEWDTLQYKHLDHHLQQFGV